jgi:hypothetical protein
MTRYHVDKVMREVIQDDAAAGAFRADTAAYLEERDLSGAEREALLARDYGTLYGLGAHPFLLWAFTRAALQASAPDVPEYVAALTPHGRPDFGT